VGRNNGAADAAADGVSVGCSMMLSIAPAINSTSTST
jgi:hypothetical protein